MPLRPLARRHERCKLIGGMNAIRRSPRVAGGCRMLPLSASASCGSLDHSQAGESMTDDVFGAYSRRSFVKTTTLATAGLIVPRTLTAMSRGQSAETIRVGVIGCGGRGTGAARDCLKAGGEGVVLVSMGDLFPDRLERARAGLAKVASEDPLV